MQAEQLDLFEALRENIAAVANVDAAPPPELVYLGASQLDDYGNDDLELWVFDQNVMGETAKNDLGRMYATALSADVPIIPMYKCCCLLAWVYVFGGGNEATTHNAKLRYAIFYAQRRMNLLGGHRPNVEWAKTLRENIRELDTYYESGKDRPDWLNELDKTYGIKTELPCNFRK